MFPNQNNVAATGPGPAPDGQQSLGYNGLPTQQQQQQLSQSTKNVRKKPYVKITEQPAGKALRFRYECEGRSAGSIPGVNSTPENKTYPTIEIVGYKGRAVVVVSCVTKDTPYRPHPHNLVGKEGCKKGVCTLEINSETMRAVFSNLGIQCVKKKDIEAALKAREEIRVDPFKTGFSHRFQPSSIDLNSVRLCFQVFMESEQKGRFTSPLPPVVSEPIFDKKAMSDLVICRLCSCSATVLGNTQIILLCEKVAKEDISVRFFEEKNGQTVWEAFGDFQHTDVHKQTAITFKTPRYHTLDITEPAKVFIQLRRPSDGVTSEALPFEYVPLDSGKHTFWNLHRHLKRKPDEDIFQQILKLDAKREAPTIEVIDLDTPKIQVQREPPLDVVFHQEDSIQEEPSFLSQEHEQDSQQEGFLQQEESLPQEQTLQHEEEQSLQQEQPLQREFSAQQSVEQPSEHLTDHTSDHIPEDMEAADAQAEAEAHRLRSEQEKEIDTIIDEKVRELEQLELGQHLEPRPLSADDKVTEWMKSSEIEQMVHEPSPTVEGDVLDAALEAHITEEDKTLNELLEQVAELDEIYTDYKVQRDTYNNTMRNELAAMEGHPPLQVEESFDDAATYTSLQIAFRNPVLIPMDDIMPPTPPMSQCAPEDAHQHYDPVEVNSQAKKPETPSRPAPPVPVQVPLQMPAIITVPFPPEEEKLPPLPPKRIRKQDSNAENRSIEANTVQARPSTAESPLNKRLPPAPSNPKNPNFNTLPRQKKPGFFSKLFSRRKSKPDLAQGSGQDSGSLLDSKMNSREPSIGHFNMQDPMRASLRSSKSAAPFLSSTNQTAATTTKTSPVKAKKPGSKLTKPVGRSVSSVSGKRPAYLNADVVHIPLKGDSANSLPQHPRTEAYSQSSTVSVGGGLDRRTASALQLADIPISEGGMELVAIADRQSLHNLVSSIEGHFNVQLDPNLDLTEAEHFALYTSIPPLAAASEFDETSAYYAPVDAGEILTPDEVAKRLAAANGLN